MTIMTEAEAAKKWCPMTRSAAFIPSGKTYRIGPAVNRVHMDASGKDVSPGEPQPYACCIASHCMMWCWDDPEVKQLGSCGLTKL